MADYKQYINKKGDVIASVWDNGDIEIEMCFYNNIEDRKVLYDAIEESKKLSLN